jgi:alpha-glucoside transport system substrate-binding protein
MKKLVMLALVIVLAAGFAFAGGKQEDKSAKEKEAETAKAEEQKVVKIMGAFRDQEAQRFEECIAVFEKQTGIEVEYEGSPEFEVQIFVQAEAGNPPDIAGLPQPGLMKEFAERGFLTPLWPGIVQKIEGNYTPAWKDLGSYDGKVYGVFHRVNAKSFVWYPKKAWDAAGYEIPETWDELIDLCDRIVADGGVPWSIGMESGAATGWVATDWMEDIMLRTAGPDVYDKWVNHEIPFNDPAVKKALDKVGEIWKNDDYVLGGSTTILTTYFGDAVKPLFEDPPQAWLHRQGNFITGFMPDDIQADLPAEVGVFALPEIDPKWGTPVLGGGDQFVVFNDRPEVREFMEFLTTWDSGKTWARAGGAIFPYQDQDFGDYANPIERKLAEILVNAEVFRFDASDLMPAEVGAGTFWTGMTDWVSGESEEATLEMIEESWP